ncbi:MAG TPA: AarF/ABC1/UbiB kinase family protein [Longimicrobium sp.]|jgi:predicted unusual protein kinase regulating ubiquinone biosynthesis (AarF/ABC1/UbiB family)|uniref:ABC1 kinase family protein n=1 Tax=Longimicrobium sp. TaxID=2029185 RepID=UPI002EDA2E2C
MGISLRPEHLKRYRDMATLLWKHGRGDLVRNAGLEDALQPDEEAALDPGAPRRADELAADLERMGPTYIKLGQLLSTRPDLIPATYADALSRLQDRVEPFPSEDAERIIAEELGVRVSKAFLEFERTPIAAASLGQVHRAVLRDGRPVAIKVQRPGIREQIVRDMDAIEDVVEFMDRHTRAGRQYEFGRTLDELRRSLLAELDYRREARNASTLDANLAEYPRIIVPRPVEDFTSARVLTMELVRGRKITAISPLARLEVDGEELAEELFRAYLKQILVDGFFHADPHPGNVFLTDDRRIALLDLGMVGVISPELQQHLVRMLIAISEGHGQEAADAAMEAGTVRSGAHPDLFSADVQALVSDFAHAGSARNLQVGRVMLEVTRSAAENGIRLPVELTMLGRALLALDQVGRTLDPDFDPNASIRRNASDLLRRRMLKNASPGRVFANMLELNELVQKLPGRLNRALEAVSDQGLEVRVRVPEEVWMLAGMQKISNRITLGLVAAALILAAAMMMQVPTRFTLLGYPGLAMLLFVAAVVLCFVLVTDILLSDVRQRRRPRDRE